MEPRIPDNGTRLRLVRILQALVLLTVYWVRVRVRPQALLRRATSPSPAPSPAAPQSPALLREITSAVDRAADLHPCRPRCLERALTIRALLVRLGADARVVIGVARPGARLDAHAWVEVGGGAIDGSRSSFTALGQFR